MSVIAMAVLMGGVDTYAGIITKQSLTKAGIGFGCEGIRCVAL